MRALLVPGWCSTASGQVLTSYHVVKAASTIKVTVAETGKTYRATVVGSDQTADVALLQLKGASSLTPVKIDNDKTSVGDKVTAVGNAGGNARGRQGTIVSLKASITTAAEGPVASETLRQMIETTADVVSGDSGGPLRRGRRGDRYRHCSLQWQRNQRLCHTDSARSWSRATDPVRAGEQHGAGWAGAVPRGGTERRVVLRVRLSGADLEERLPQQSRASSGAAAAQAGLEAGDQITALGGHAVTSAEDVSALLADYNPGDHIKIVWIDQVGQSRQAATVTLGASPVADPSGTPVGGGTRPLWRDRRSPSCRTSGVVARVTGQ